MAVKATAVSTASRRMNVPSAARTGRARNRCVRSEAKYVLTQVGDIAKSQFAKETVEVKVFEVASGIRTVGRNETSDHPHMKIVINAPTVSGDHARLSVVDSTLYCEDLGSTNGTILNGKKMKKGTAYPVQVGSSLIFGDKNLASYKVSEEPDEGGDGATGDAGSDPVGSEQ